MVPISQRRKKETETQRGQLTYPRSNSQKVRRLELYSASKPPTMGSLAEQLKKQELWKKAAQTGDTALPLPSCDLEEVALPLWVLIFSPEAHKCKAESLAHSRYSVKNGCFSPVRQPCFTDQETQARREHDPSKVTQPTDGRAEIQPRTFRMCPLNTQRQAASAPSPRGLTQAELDWCSWLSMTMEVQP